MSSAPTPESSPTFDLRHTSATDTIRLLALFLSHASHANDALPRKPALTRFHARTIPSIDILGYLSRILKYAPCGPECFLAVLIYFERMCGNPDGSLLTPVDPVVDSAVPAHVGAASAATPATASDAVVDGSATAPASVSASGSTLASASASGSGSAAQETVDATQQHMRRQSSAAELISADSPLPPGKRLHIVINSYNVHRLLIAGSMIAVKFLSDVFYTNSHMAKVGGLPVQELNRLEIEFLLFNDFNLNVTTDELQASGDKLLAFALEHGAPLPVPYVAPPVAAPEPAAETEAAAASGQDHMVEAVAAPQPPAPTDPGAAGSETASHAANHSGPGAGSSPGSGTPPSHSHDAAHRHRIPSTSATPSVDAGAGADGDVVMSQALPSQPSQPPSHSAATHTPVQTDSAFQSGHISLAAHLQHSVQHDHNMDTRPAMDQDAALPLHQHSAEWQPLLHQWTVADSFADEQHGQDRPLSRQLPLAKRRMRELTTGSVFDVTSHGAGGGSVSVPSSAARYAYWWDSSSDQDDDADSITVDAASSSNINRKLGYVVPLSSWSSPRLAAHLRLRARLANPQLQHTTRANLGIGCTTPEWRRKRPSHLRRRAVSWLPRPQHQQRNNQGRRTQTYTPFYEIAVPSSPYDLFCQHLRILQPSSQHPHHPTPPHQDHLDYYCSGSSRCCGCCAQQQHLRGTDADPSPASASANPSISHAHDNEHHPHALHHCHCHCQHQHHE